MFHDKGVEHLVRSQFRAIMPKEPPANPHVSEFVVGFCFSFLQTSQEFDEGIEAQLRVMGTQPSLCMSGFWLVPILATSQNHIPDLTALSMLLDQVLYSKLIQINIHLYLFHTFYL